MLSRRVSPSGTTRSITDGFEDLDQRIAGKVDSGPPAEQGERGFVGLGDDRGHEREELDALGSRPNYAA
ncbi:hypothetical protein [Amycolatopsis sp. cmx-11-51]|uniref:hypothetical protein n=1 Tax=unclassified Amycolatopsis TaxID=2618356 RepID=UPI0039E290F5